MKVKEIKEMLRDLVEQELEQEYDYQARQFVSDSGTKVMSQDKEYLAKLIACKQWLIKGTSMPIVESMIIQKDIEEYLK